MRFYSKFKLYNSTSSCILVGKKKRKKKKKNPEKNIKI